MIHARPDYNRIQDPASLIPEDEPVFLIRAKDVTSGDAVRAWADLAEQAGAAPNIIAAARAHAERMDAWREKQIPDMPDAGPEPAASGWRWERDGVWLILKDERGQAAEAYPSAENRGWWRVVAHTDTSKAPLLMLSDVVPYLRSILGDEVPALPGEVEGG